MTRSPPTGRESDRLVRGLFGTHWQRTVHLARLLGAADPEAAAAEGFTRLYAHRSRVDDADSAAGYLHRTVVNLVRDEHRRLGRRTSAPPAVVMPVGDDTPADADDQQDVLAAVRRLPDRQREAVVLRYWLDLSEAQMATAMHLRTGTVKTHLRRGLAALATTLNGGA